MATTVEILKALDEKTNAQALKISLIKEDTVAIKALITKLKEDNPAVAAQAQGILDKMGNMDTDLGAVEVDLQATGKDGAV